MKNRRIKPRRQIAEINIVPYVDVMLVLLIIFMVAAPMMMQGVQVELPEASAKALPQDEPLPVVVSVDIQGLVYLNIAEVNDKPIEPLMLQAEVQAAMTRNPKRLVLVKADKHVPYNTVLDVMVLLQQAGVPSVGLQTTPMPGNG